MARFWIGSDKDVVPRERAKTRCAKFCKASYSATEVYGLAIVLDLFRMFVL